MYFLPAFLSHYRSLGVQRFVFLNDRSDDGSFQYLLQQPDVTIVESDRSYGDVLELPQHLNDATLKPWMRSTLYHWRAMLHDKFALEQWALQVDLDEFIWLPEGITFPGLVERLKKQSARAIWGVMLDVYPRDIAALAKQANHLQLDRTAAWYFDAERHLRLRLDGSRPRTMHPGARARLFRSYDLDKAYPDLWTEKRRTLAWQRKLPWLSFRPLRFNATWKPVLLKWSNGCYFRGSHTINFPAAAHFLLPIQHFFFSGSLYRKIQTALLGQSHAIWGYPHYRLQSELLRRMQEQNGSFLYRKSRPFESFSDLSRTGNAVGL